MGRSRRGAGLAVGAWVLGLLVGCAGPQEAVGPPRKETVFAIDARLDLLRFNAGQPQRVLARVPITGLAAGETVLGIDFRVARGVLYALGSTGRLYTLDTVSAVARPVGSGAAAIPLSGTRFGFDFNPVADRIRLVGDTGLNLRLHPDTGAVVDGDPSRDGVQPDTPLAYAVGDVHAGEPPALVAAAYTYNKQNDRITTNFAIDRRLGVLVVQGSAEGATPFVSPNTGQLRTVGALGLGVIDDAAFDIADVSGAAFAAVRLSGQPRTRLVRIDLSTGRAEVIGTVGDGTPLLGISVEP